MPKSLPTITEAQIKRWVGATYAQRGKSYFRNGHVVEVRWRGRQLTGRVQGSEYQPYQVTILFDGQHIEGDCSCPMGYNCKHVAALLYASPAPASPRRAPKPVSFDKPLEKLDRPALLALLTVLLNQAPELAEAMETYIAALSWATPEGAEALRERIGGLVSKLNNWLTDKAADQALETLLGQADALIKHSQWEPAHAIVQTLLSELILLDPENTWMSLDVTVQPAVERLVACWRALSADNAARRNALRALFEVLAWEVYGLAKTPVSAIIEKALLKQASPAERGQLREWMALASLQAVHRPRPALADDEFEDDNYYDDYEEDEVEAGWLRQRWQALEKRFAEKPTIPAAKKTAAQRQRPKPKAKRRTATKRTRHRRGT